GCHTVLCACVRRSLRRGSSQGCCTDILTRSGWASGGPSISIPCPRPQSCTAPAGGAGSGEKHIGVELATGGPARLCLVGDRRPLARTRAGSRYTSCSRTGPPASCKNAPRSDLLLVGEGTSLLLEDRPSITGPHRS